MRKLGFTIKADPNLTPLTTLDEHVTVGGAFFDVMSGTYEIRKVSDREVDLDTLQRAPHLDALQLLCPHLEQFSDERDSIEHHEGD
jgi:hypothetical protein